MRDVEYNTYGSKVFKDALEVANRILAVYRASYRSERYDDLYKALEPDRVKLRALLPLLSVTDRIMFDALTGGAFTRTTRP